MLDLPHLTVDVVSKSCGAVIRLEGEVDIASVDRLRDATSRAMDMDGIDHLIVDCRQLDFLDSSGLKALLEAHRRVDGKLALLGPTRPITRVLEVTGLEELFEVAESLEAATQALHQT